MENSTIHQLRRYILAQIHCQGIMEEYEISLFSTKRKDVFYELTGELLKELPKQRVRYFNKSLKYIFTFFPPLS